MSFSRYLRILRERWRAVLVGLLLGLTAAAALTWTATPLYSADVVMFVAAQDDSGDAAGAYQGSLMSQQKVKSYAALLDSDRVRQDIERRMGATIEPGAIGAAAKPGTVLLTATATDPSPERAKDIADAVGTTFPGLVAELERPADGTQPSVVVRVVEPAAVPTSSVSPEPLLNLAIGAALGLLAGFAGALARNFLDNSVKSVEAMEELVDAPALGAVAFRSDIRVRPLVVHDPPGSPGAEAHRRIRTNLRFVDVDHPPRVMAVVSAIPGESKTTTACNLAVMFAESGLSVTLVDGDLRRPQIAQTLGVEGAVGLTSVLIGHVSLSQATQHWGPEGLSVLTSGPIPPNPSELLASQHMVRLLTELAGRCDAVIVDTPPLLPVTDAAILASRCDGALLIIRHGKTTKKQVRSAVAALAAVSARLVGTVLTMVPKSRFQGKYDEYHYGYGSACDPQEAAEHRPAAEPGRAMPWARRVREAGNRTPDRHREVDPTGLTAFDRVVVRAARRRGRGNPRPRRHRWRSRLVLACVLLTTLGATAAADSAW